jgi:hypothetical protein
MTWTTEPVGCTSSVPLYRGTGLTGGMLHGRREACREACNEGNHAEVIRNLIPRLDRAIPRG